MKYAFTRNNVVTYIESRDIPLDQLYPEELREQFVPVPVELQDTLLPGWKYDPDTQTFTEPHPGQYIPELDSIYTPSTQVLTALLVQTAQDVTQAQLDAIAIQQQLTGLELDAMKGA